MSDLMYRCLAALAAFLLVQSAFIYAHFPTPEQYRPAADEGIYFRQGVTVLDQGFKQLGDDFVSNKAVHNFPHPLRVGHLLLAATAIAIDRSFTSLSVLSLVCHVALSMLTFVFVRRWSGDAAALIAALLVATSPFEMAAARRALMDAEYCLFAVLPVLLFVTWTMNDQRRYFIGFIVALIWGALVKETTMFLLPAFAVAIVMAGLLRNRTIAWRHLAALMIVPVVVAVTYVAVFGVDRAVEMVRITRASNQTETNEYMRVYNWGPWASFFVDRFLVAPLAMLAFLLLCGWYAARRHVIEPSFVLLVLFVVGLAIYMFMPQSARYASPLDMMTRLFIALAIATIAAARQTFVRALAVGAVAIMMLTDTLAFYQVFVRHDVYDPVTYNLAVSRGVIGEQPVPGPLNADGYLGLSVGYYNARDFHAAIEMSERALKLRPDDASAYNNIGVSYNSLGRWSDAIPALQTALKLKPDFALARNNLQWAETELAKSRR